MDERILIELFIPQLGRRDDLNVMADMTLCDFVSVVNQYYCEGKQNDNVVMLTDNGMLQDLTLTVSEAGIRTGQTLVFIVLQSESGE